MTNTFQNNKKISICQIWDYYLPLFSGAAIRHNQLSSYLSDQGISTQVLTRQWESTKHEEIIGAVSVCRVPHSRYKCSIIQQVTVNFLMCIEIWKRRKSFNILYAMSTSLYRIPVYFFAKILGKPVVMEFTLLKEKEKTLQAKTVSKLEFFSFNWFDSFIGLSSPLVRDMIKRGLPEKKCYLIPGGVDSDMYTPVDREERLQLRDKLGIKRDAIYLLFIGNFLRRKGIDLLIEMMVYLKKKHNNVYLIIVGAHDFPRNSKDQEFANTQKKIILDEKLDKYIHLVGRVPPSDVIRWLQVSDVFVFPSRREGLPRSLLQAMSAALPCVCSSLEGIAYDVIEPDVDGIVIEDDRSNVFAKQVERILKDHTLKSRLGMNARKKIIRNFDEKHLVLRYIDIFHQLLTNK